MWIQHWHSVSENDTYVWEYMFKTLQHCIITEIFLNCSQTILKNSLTSKEFFTTSITLKFKEYRKQRKQISQNYFSRILLQSIMIFHEFLLHCHIPGLVGYFCLDPVFVSGLLRMQNPSLINSSAKIPQDVHI